MLKVAMKNTSPGKHTFQLADFNNDSMNLEPPEV